MRAFCGMRKGIEKQFTGRKPLLLEIKSGISMISLEGERS